MNTPTSGDSDHELRRAEDRLFAAIEARDLGALDGELTDDFVYTQIGGGEQNRESFLAAIRDMPFRILELRGEGIQVRVMDGVGVLSGVQQAKVEMTDGSIVSGATAFVDVFVMTVRGWRLRHACSIELPAPAQAAS